MLVAGFREITGCYVFLFPRPCCASLVSNILHFLVAQNSNSCLSKQRISSSQICQAELKKQEGYQFSSLHIILQHQINNILKRYVAKKRTCSGFAFFFPPLIPTFMFSVASRVLYRQETSCEVWNANKIFQKEMKKENPSLFPTNLMTGNREKKESILLFHRSNGSCRTMFIRLLSYSTDHLSYLANRC